MRRRPPTLPPGCWLQEEALWGERQRVQLTTGPAALVCDTERVRSIHLVGFLGGGVLLAQNRDGSYTFPGGRLEEAESIDDALRRELWEEVGARVAPDYAPIAATRIQFINRVPGRVYRVHPTYLLWVAGTIDFLTETMPEDPAKGVVDRRLATPEEARTLLPALERRVLEATLERRSAA
jgi:8-oxo-dGTP pyrophosphatase MutT (NUDIX family)